MSDDDSVEALEKRSELVQRRLALLGRVNLLATGEFEALQERHDFMARELDDVKHARRDLLEVIAQVDREITATFTTAYQDVALQFERLIKDLFPGGDGRLVLTDPAEPLTSGIEIEASPGRKRVKRISLLSGGERSLTAMAFLFAIFTARPSPFYLMDEVEPALDWYTGGNQCPGQPRNHGAAGADQHRHSGPRADCRGGAHSAGSPRCAPPPHRRCCR